jgi:hypothetical protein
MVGRLSVGERPETLDEPATAHEPGEGIVRPATPSAAWHRPETLPAHPERVPPADDVTPENLAFWAQVHRIKDDVVPPDRRGRRD